MEANTMRCPRCNGFTYHHDFYDYGFDEFSGWKCFNCGEIFDPVILLNKAKSVKTTPISP